MLENNDNGKFDFTDGEKIKGRRQANIEGRLLDLSIKNALINFKSSGDCVRLNFGEVCSAWDRLSAGESFFLELNKEGKSRDKNCVGGDILRGETHTVGQGSSLSSLIRKGKLCEEELGANAIYIACGFLKWRRRGEKNFKLAPIALMSVALQKNRAGQVRIFKTDDFGVNDTLIEFLSRELGLRIEFTAEEVLSLDKIFSRVAAAVKGYGFSVVNESYLSQFKFLGYAMWRDIKNNFGEYSLSPVISKLFNSEYGFEDMRESGEDLCNPEDILTPLECDSYQYSAIAKSVTGKSFVLHGPPGTGKSQTIANIIANALYRGKRVLFVAEKQAALNVVKRRLDGIGIGDFCLALHSCKTLKKEELMRLIATNLTLKKESGDEKFSEVCEEIKSLTAALGRPYRALHEKRAFGISVYQGICRYFENYSAPDVVGVQADFYKKLTADKMFFYEDMIISARAAARECGEVSLSPFKWVNIAFCDEGVKEGVLYAARSAVTEIERFKKYLSLFLQAFNQKPGKFAFDKLNNLIKIIALLSCGALNDFLSCGEEELYNFFNANIRYSKNIKAWFEKFCALPQFSDEWEGVEKELKMCGGDYTRSKLLRSVNKKISRLARADLECDGETVNIALANQIYKDGKIILSNDKLSGRFTNFNGDINENKRIEFVTPFLGLHKLCAQTFEDYSADCFNSACVRAADGRFDALLRGLKDSIGALSESAEYLLKLIGADKKLHLQGDICGAFLKKCNALIENIDMLPRWCAYRETANKLNASGLKFIADSLENGKIKTDEMLSSFRKNVYFNFVCGEMEEETNYCGYSATVISAAAERLKILLGEYTLLCRKKIRNSLIERLPDCDGRYIGELALFKKYSCANMRGVKITELFINLPNLINSACPCLMMSPLTVSQYLPPIASSFDLVVFDEASQLSMEEAYASLARAKSAVVVGDPKQMPPTSFFMSLDGSDEADAESVLDSCIAAGMPEKHLIWHYRSRHESLIEFSNKSYYFSKLCTFPSVDGSKSKVKFEYVRDGVYLRGGSKCNGAEAETVTDEVIKRLKSDDGRNKSIGVVTFSAAQQVYVEKLLYKKLAENHLEEAAFDRLEPLFVKNLENVQGDERDVILFSVCYGPDGNNRISLNFGPLNKSGGWRRLNVAASRAREEMTVFSSMRYIDIDIARAPSRGTANLRAFLEFAEKGKMPCAYENPDKGNNVIAEFIAQALSDSGYECRCGAGVSAFKIDVCVVDPNHRERYILGVLIDGESDFSIKDRFITQNQALNEIGWHIYRVYSANFFINSNREIKKIKQRIEALTRLDRSIS